MACQKKSALVCVPFIQRPLAPTFWRNWTKYPIFPRGISASPALHVALSSPKVQTEAQVGRAPPRRLLSRMRKPPVSHLQQTIKNQVVDQFKWHRHARVHLPACTTGHDAEWLSTAMGTNVLHPAFGRVRDGVGAATGEVIAGFGGADQAPSHHGLLTQKPIPEPNVLPSALKSMNPLLLT